MLTEETVQNIAPSYQNFEDGKDLKVDIFETGKKQHFFWGKYQGSGKNPYTLMFDEHSLKSKCSCPVGKRGTVCKHVLGLMLKSIDTPQEFTESEPPEWAADWINKQLEKQQEATQAAQSGEKPKIGLERIRDAKSKSAKNREKQMNEGIDLLLSYLNDILNEGTLAAYSSWGDERKNILINSLNSAKMPELAYMVDSELDNNPAETITKAAILANLWQKRDTLSAEAQEFLLSALGSYIKKEDVIALKDIVKDTWLCVGYYDEMRRSTTSFSIIRLHYWFLIGQTTGQWAKIMHTELPKAYGNMEAAPNLNVGTVYEGSIAYFPASQRGILLLQDWKVSDEEYFVLKQDIVPHYPDKMIAELPLSINIKSVKNPRIQKIDEDRYLIETQNQVYECKQNLECLEESEDEEFTLICAYVYPHSVIVLGVLGDISMSLINLESLSDMFYNIFMDSGVPDTCDLFCSFSPDLQNDLNNQYVIPEQLKKRLEIGKKMGDIELNGLDNKGLSPVQQWARTFLWYNYGVQKAQSNAK